MTNGKHQLTVYSTLLSRYQLPQLSIIEIYVLEMLRNGLPAQTISEQLGFPVYYIMADLVNKKVLDEEGIFRYRNQEELEKICIKKHEKGFLFFDLDIGLFYNCFVLPHEIKIKEDGALAIGLGQSFVTKDILDQAKIISCFPLTYEPNSIRDAGFQYRKATVSAFELANFVYEGRLNG